MSEEQGFESQGITFSDDVVIIDFNETVSSKLGIERFEGRPCDFFPAIQALRAVWDSLKEPD